VRSVRLAAAAAALLLVRRRRAPVGHFTSAAAQDRFQAAYDAALELLPRPDQVLDVRTGFGIVRLYRFGDGPARSVPLVLLPGRASAAPVWAANLPTLVEQGPVYALDLLGEPGMSVQSRPITSADDHAAWLQEVLALLPAPRLDLLGLSIGGWTAMNLVARRATKVRSVVLLDPVLVYAPLAPAAVVRSIPAGLPWLPRTWRDRFTSWTAADAPVRDEPVARMIEAGMRDYRLRLPAPRRIPAGLLAGIDVPVLVVVAGRSRMHDPAALAATARHATPNAEVIVYPTASHAVNGEYPQRVAQDVAAFRDKA